MLTTINFFHEVFYMAVIALPLAGIMRFIHVFLLNVEQSQNEWRDAVVEEFGEYYSRTQVEAMKRSAELRGDMYSVVRCNKVLNG